MKRTISVLFAIPIAGLVLLGGCKKDDGPVDSGDLSGISETDAADIIASALAGSQATGGLTAQIEQASTVAIGGSIQKAGGIEIPSGVLTDTTIVVAKDTGLYTYNYTFWYSYFVNNGNLLNFNYRMKGVYGTPRLTGNDSVSAALVVANGFSTQSIDGSYVRIGSQTFKSSRLTLSSRFSLSFSNTAIDRGSKQIQTGFANISLSGSTSTGKSFAISTTITFVGNQTARMTINGKMFTLNLTLGTALAS